MRSCDIQIDQAVCSLATGSLVWQQILIHGHFPDAASAVDRELCLDVLARCEEWGIEPDPEYVIEFIAELIDDVDPGNTQETNTRRATELIHAISG